MKTISVVKTMIVGAVLLAAVTAARAAIVYDFSSNANGWSSVDNQSALYQSADGNPAGSIRINPWGVYSAWPTMTLDAVTFGKDFDISFDWYAADRNQFKMGDVSIGFDQGTTWGTGLDTSAGRDYTFSGWTRVEWTAVAGITTMKIGGVTLYSGMDYSAVLAASGNKFSAAIWAYGPASLDNFTIIPEPASLALLALAGTVMLRRRRG